MGPPRVAACDPDAGDDGADPGRNRHVEQRASPGRAQGSTGVDLEGICLAYCLFGVQDARWKGRDEDNRRL